MPTKSNFSPGPTRSGTDAFRNDCNSAWVKPTKGTVMGIVTIGEMLPSSYGSLRHSRPASVGLELYPSERCTASLLP